MRSVATSIAFLAGCASLAGAQSPPPIRLQKPSGAAGTVASPPPPAPQPASEPRGRTHGAGMGSAAVRYTTLPAIVMQDGRVFVQLDNAYFYVPQACSAGTAANAAVPTYNAPTYNAPTYSPPAYTQPEVTQPVPRAQTSSQAMIAQSQAGAQQGQRVDTRGCWLKGDGGRVFVRRW
ncbi:MAG TPA: hypothetical protein VG818_13830 [Gemmatimonadaceae bacterium]|nr:hypothetical protein [Gemmatimonadaceae bacterium]